MRRPRRNIIHFRDPVFGTVLLTSDELRVVETTEYQRLRNIKQLGFTDHAFPGATHTRFVHSLGAAHVAGQIFDAIFPVDDPAPLPPAERRRLRQLLRLAVLLHDVGHAPLSHATEGCMPLRGALALDHFDEAQRNERASHEDYTVLLVLRSRLSEVLRRIFGPQGIEPEDVAHLISGCFPGRADRLRVRGVDYGPLLSQLVSGELDADRMDYLLRDSFYTGVNYGKFDEQWLLNNLGFHVVDDRACLALSHRAIFAFEDFLLSRYHMFVSVYYHHTSIGLDTMLTRFIEEQPDAFEFPCTCEAYVSFDDVAFWALLRASSNRWARRIVERDHYKRILELHADHDVDLAGLQAALRSAGIDHFISRDESVLSRYYGAGSAAPIFVINRALHQAIPVQSYSRVFERYAQPARLIRLYCDPQAADRARELMQAFVPPEKRQLTLGFSG